VLRKIAGSDLVRYILMPEQEFVEASVMLAIANESHLPSLEKLRVSPSSYILGLLDAIGELRRSVFDSIRKDQLKVAENRFAIMESLYKMLSPFAVYDNIVSGVKRKLDIARNLVEDTRSVITEEARRGEFMIAVRDLSSKIGASPFWEKMKDREPATYSDGDENNRQEPEGGQEPEPSSNLD
jgi:translin